MSPDVLTIKFNASGQYIGASVRMLDGTLVPAGVKDGVSMEDIMAQLTRHQLARLAAAAQAQIAIIDAGAPPRKPWYRRMFGA